MMHLVAIFSPVLAGYFLGERLMAYHFIGFGLILFGVWMAAKPATKSAAKA
jgi:drug/metabolite transporter (DMT)-like permease